MSAIRCIYRGAPPEFPATDQHPDAVRHGPIALPDGSVVFVDALGGAPSLAEIDAVLNPPPAPPPTPLERLTAAGLTVDELKGLLGLA